MGRIAREILLYNGCFAHIFTRAIEKRKIFEKSEDFGFFKKKLEDIKKEYGFKVFHYCLMQTHVHMVVGIQEVGKFSGGMKVLKKSYAHQYNTVHKRFGPMWRDRFKCKLIENEAYLYACGRYVENNPVRAGLVERAEDWPYSSSRHYELGEKDLIIDAYDLTGGGSTENWKSEEFEKMKAIGSGWFQYKFHKQLKS